GSDNIGEVSRHEGADRSVTLDEAGKVRLVGQVENDYRQLVVHTERQSGAVHDFQAALQGFHVGEVVELPRIGVLVGVGVVDTVDPILGHHQHLGTDLEGAERGGRVGREVRVAGAGDEDHHAPLFEMTNRASPNVWFSDFGHR